MSLIVPGQKFPALGVHGQEAGRPTEDLLWLIPYSSSGDRAHESNSWKRNSDGVRATETATSSGATQAPNRSVNSRTSLSGHIRITRFGSAPPREMFKGRSHDLDHFRLAMEYEGNKPLRGRKGPEGTHFQAGFVLSAHPPPEWCGVVMPSARSNVRVDCARVGDGAGSGCRKCPKLWGRVSPELTEHAVPAIRGRREPGRRNVIRVRCRERASRW